MNRRFSLNSVAFNGTKISFDTVTAIRLHSTKLLDRVKEAIRDNHLSASAELMGALISFMY